MEFAYSVFKQDKETLLAISDIDIIGETFAERDLQLIVSKEFYASKRGDEKEIIGLLKKATIVNAVGKETMLLLMQENIVNAEGVIKIGGVPHAQIISIR